MRRQEEDCQCCFTSDCDCECATCEAARHDREEMPPEAAALRDFAGALMGALEAQKEVKP